jgi:hypothetical protein
MASPSEYISIMEQGNEFINSHNELLQSLLLSKQNAANNRYTEETNGDANGTQYPGEGISSASNESPA